MASSLDATLKKILLELAEEIKIGIVIKLNGGNYPSGSDDSRINLISIQDSIEIREPESNDGTASIEVTIGGEYAPYASAFEYGSGLHASRGAAKKYKITATDKLLKFPFTLTFMPLGGKFAGMRGYGKNRLYKELMGGDNGSVSGITFWNFVEHPGIKPKPYVKPALVEAVKSKAFLRIGEEIKQAIKLEILLGDSKVEEIK